MRADGVLKVYGMGGISQPPRCVDAGNAAAPSPGNERAGTSVHQESQANWRWYPSRLPISPTPVGFPSLSLRAHALERLRASYTEIVAEMVATVSRVQALLRPRVAH
jgi:hypothetical protein